MRRPTPTEQLYAWHSARLAGLPDPDGVDWQEPQPGWYRYRFGRGRPWMPVKVWMDQPIDPETGELDGEETLRAAFGRNGEPFHKLEERWMWLQSQPISEDAYWRLIETHPTAYLKPVDLTERPARP